MVWPFSRKQKNNVWKSPPEGANNKRINQNAMSKGIWLAQVQDLVKQYKEKLDAKPKEGPVNNRSTKFRTIAQELLRVKEKGLEPVNEQIAELTAEKTRIEGKIAELTAKKDEIETKYRKNYKEEWNKISASDTTDYKGLRELKRAIAPYAIALLPKYKKQANIFRNWPAYQGAPYGQNAADAAEERAAAEPIAYFMRKATDEEILDLLDEHPVHISTSGGKQRRRKTLKRRSQEGY